MEEVGVEATTVKLTGGLVTPNMLTVILVFPATMPLAKPAKDMVATSGLELAQFARVFMYTISPFE